VVEQALLLLRVAFVVLLYLFVWWVVRASVRDVRAPQESMILSAEQARAAGLGAPAPPPSAAPQPAVGPRLRVVDGPVWPSGSVVVLDEDVVFGRAPDCDAVLDGDSTASAHHARVFHREGALYAEDLGSTNGTYVNGQRLVAERRLRDGDNVAIGATALVYEAGVAA
jgi:hypothetical protein